MIGFCVAVLLLGLVSGGCRSSAQPARPTADLTTAVSVPGTGGGPEDHIDAVDFAVGPGETLHVTWREVDYAADGGLPAYRTLYARGAMGGASWSPPETLPAADAPARIFRGPGGIHVLAGSGLEHRYREDGGTWRELGRILPEGKRAPGGSIPGFAYFGVAVDAVADGDGLAVALLSRGGPNQPLRLEFVLRRPGGATTPRQLAAYPDAGPQQPAPRLIGVGARRHLLWAVAEESRETVESRSGPVERFSSRARLFYTQSDDRGISWRSPVEITASLAATPQTIDDVEMLVTEEALVALYSSRGLYASRSVDGRSWSRPARIAGYRERSGTTSTGSWSLTAAAGAIAWIDERFQSSDRRWWKPLGGWPWSDNPEGLDNDVFLLPPSAARRALAGGDAEPRRQTPERSFAYLARLRASHDHLYLLWTGRRLAGEPSSSDRTSPEIFYRRIF